MTTDTDPRPAGAADIESFLRYARAQVRARVSRTDRFVDAYTAVFVTAVLVAWGVAGLNGLGSSVGALADAGAPGGVLYRPAVWWVGEGAPLVGASVLLTGAWIGVVGLLRGLGPVGVVPERVLWVWPLPSAGGQEPLRAVRRMLCGAAAAGVLLGGTGLLLLWGTGLTREGGGWWWQAGAYLVCWAGLGVGAVGVSIRAQAAAQARKPPRSYPPVGWAVALAVVLVLVDGTRDAGPGLWEVAVLGLPTSWPLTVLLVPPAAAAGLAVLSAVLAVLAGVAALRWARTLDGEQLRTAGARTRHLTNAVSLMSTQDLHTALNPTTRQVLRPTLGRTPDWVAGPRTVVLFASLTALRASRWRSGLVVDLGLTVILLVSFAETVVLAGWAVLLLVGYRGLGRGTAYLVDLRAGAAAERNLPIGPTAAALVHLLLPCALNAAVLAAVALLAALAAGTASPVLLLLGAVAGAGTGAVAAYRSLAPEPDHTQPPIDTPLGPVPVAQLISYSRGLLLVLALLAAPAVVLLHPAAGPVALAGATALALTAVVLAVGGDRQH